MSNFDVDLTLTDLVLTFKYGYLFNVNMKILVLHKKQEQNFLESTYNQLCFNIKFPR